jgi:hypothetical protein
LSSLSFPFLPSFFLTLEEKFRTVSHSFADFLPIPFSQSILDSFDHQSLLVINNFPCHFLLSPLPGFSPAKNLPTWFPPAPIEPQLARCEANLSSKPRLATPLVASFPKERRRRRCPRRMQQSRSRRRQSLLLLLPLQTLLLRHHRHPNLL